MSPAVQQAAAAGFTHVRTLLGLLPLAAWTLADDASLTFEPAGRLVGPWRDVAVGERMCAETTMGTTADVELRARDVWRLVSFSDAIAEIEQALEP